MKEVLKELDRGLLKAGKWFLYSKTVENFVATILLCLVAIYGLVIGIWLWKQFTASGWF